MIASETVDGVILAALEGLNRERTAAEQIALSPQTPLFGADSQIDSLSLVSLIVDVETTLNADHGLAISLADDRALARKQSPYASVETLRDYVLELAREEGKA
jgi:acyl carrier protein